MDRGRLSTALATLALLAGAPAAAAEHAPPLPRVLELFDDDPEMTLANSVFQVQFRAAFTTPIELRTEHFDGGQLSRRPYRDAFRQWLSIRYADLPPQVVVALGEDAVGFLADPSCMPWPGVPVVFGRVDDRIIKPEWLPSGFTGVFDHLAVTETLDLARALFPDVRRVAVVAGASHTDLRQAELLRQEATAYARRLEVVDLVGLPVPEIVDRVRALPATSIVLIGSYETDPAGRRWSEREVVRRLSALQAAPVFTMRADLVGYGAVGGAVTSYEESAQRVARLVEAMLARSGGSVEPPQRAAPSRIVLDGRELERWHVPDRRIPGGAEVRFRPAGSWNRYIRPVLFFSAALAVETLLIGGLLVERRRRRSAERRARENLAAIAHMNRIGAVGELTGSFAHELNTPLGAVLNNAQAARRFLAQGATRSGEVLSCLEDIVTDACRAGEVVRRMRGVMRREDVRQGSVDVAAAIRDAARLAEAEARDRDVSLATAVESRLPPIRGDEVQLVQVILNLILNALDALESVPRDRRRIAVRGSAATGGAEIVVQDTGPGIDPALVDKVFEPFFTTKTSGLGMGLAITRSIVEAHGGYIRVLPAPGGCTFRVFLPEARAEREGIAHG